MMIDDAQSALAWLASWRGGRSGVPGYALPPRGVLASAIEGQHASAGLSPAHSPSLRAGHVAALRVLRDAWPSDYGPLPIDAIAIDRVLGGEL